MAIANIRYPQRKLLRENLERKKPSMAHGTHFILVTIINLTELTISLTEVVANAISGVLQIYKINYQHKKVVTSIRLSTTQNKKLLQSAPSVVQQ